MHIGDWVPRRSSHNWVPYEASGLCSTVEASEVQPLGSAVFCNVKARMIHLVHVQWSGPSYAYPAASAYRSSSSSGYTAVNGNKEGNNMLTRYIGACCKADQLHRIMDETLHYQQEGQLSFGRAPTTWERATVGPCPIGTRKDIPTSSILASRVCRDTR
jgi:hypothetical protein